MELGITKIVSKETERVERETTERVANEAIRVDVVMLRDMNIGDSEIKEALKKSHGLSEQEACAYLQ